MPTEGTAANPVRLPHGWTPVKFTIGGLIAVVEATTTRFNNYELLATDPAGDGLVPPLPYDPTAADAPDFGRTWDATYERAYRAVLCASAIPQSPVTFQPPDKFLHVDVGGIFRAVGSPEPTESDFDELDFATTSNEGCFSTVVAGYRRLHCGPGTPGSAPTVGGFPPGGTTTGWPCVLNPNILIDGRLFDSPQGAACFIDDQAIITESWFYGFVAKVTPPEISVGINKRIWLVVFGPLLTEISVIEAGSPIDPSGGDGFTYQNEVKLAYYRGGTLTFDASHNPSSTGTLQRTVTRDFDYLAGPGERVRFNRDGFV